MNETKATNEGPVTVSKIMDANLLAKSGVTNDHGENLGKIDSLMIDLESGKISYAILGFGGFPNRTKLFAVPWELLTFSHHDKKLILNVPRELLVKSAGYDTVDQVLQNADFYWLGEIYEYYSHKNEWDQKRAEEKNEDKMIAQRRREEARKLTSPPASSGSAA
jgi:sporulation protein YlmC with PRC-barrel domain